MRRLFCIVLLLVGPRPVWGVETPRIADLWYAHNEIVVMLGAADRVAVTVAAPSTFPWMYRVAPVLARAQVVPNGVPNVEALLAARVGLAFVPTKELADRIKAIGIQAVHVSFTDSASLLDCIGTTATAIGSETASQRASDYAAYLVAIRDRIARRLSDRPGLKRPSVLHVASMVPLRIDGAGTIVDEWIRIAGGVNVASDVRGNLAEVSFEQILQWDPDIIIVGRDGGDLPRPDSLWSSLSAVKNQKVYRNPAGVFPWDRYGSEFALQLIWSAKIFHRDLFDELDINAEAKMFFRRFFAYELSDHEAGLILAAKPPPVDR